MRASPIEETLIRVCARSKRTRLESCEDLICVCMQESKLIKDKLPVAKCAVYEKLNAAIKKLVRTGYHHVWIVDDNTTKRVVGVLSLTDSEFCLLYRR